MANVVVLRLGHRKTRDKRVSTHVFLAARALGANGGVLCGEEDETILGSVRKVSEKWGGKFPISFARNWKKELLRKRRQGFTVVHLTMYGEKLMDRIGAIRRKKRLLVVVGAQKVPPEAYSLADYNISVTGQPHSEVAALAVFLHELSNGKELDARFPGARIRIAPSARGKRVMKGAKRAYKTHLYK